MRVAKIILLRFFYVLFFYLLIFGALVFKAHQPMPSALNYDAQALLEHDHEDGYAYLLEAPEDAFDVRIALMMEANESIDVSYYAMHDGHYTDVFYATLLDAAQRGVTVRLIIDGFIEGRLLGDQNPIQVLVHHDNITVAYYEPFRIYRPHAMQNRLHDKLIIIDGHYAITGGRNIGARFFEESDDTAYDRDILIYGEDSHPAVNAMQDYYDTLFDSPYSVVTQKRNLVNLDETRDYLIDLFETIDASFDRDAVKTNIHNNSHAVDAINFIHSPLNRMIKEPVVYETLVELATYHDTLWVQSPYIIFTEPMLSIADVLRDKDIVMLTNSPFVNPNIAAVSGYMRQREAIGEAVTLYEYQGQGSLHAKTVLMDDNITVIGSLNLDPRSTFLSTESMMVVVSESFNDAVRQAMEDQIAQSLEFTGEQYVGDVEVAEASHMRRAVIRIVGWLTYFFDWML